MRTQFCIRRPRNLTDATSHVPPSKLLRPMWRQDSENPLACVDQSEVLRHLCAEFSQATTGERTVRQFGNLSCGFMAGAKPPHGATTPDHTATNGQACWSCG